MRSVCANLVKSPASCLLLSNIMLRLLSGAECPDRPLPRGHMTWEGQMSRGHICSCFTQHSAITLLFYQTNPDQLQEATTTLLGDGNSQMLVDIVRQTRLIMIRSQPNYFEVVVVLLLFQFFGVHNVLLWSINYLRIGIGLSFSKMPPLLQSKCLQLFK